MQQNALGGDEPGCAEPPQPCNQDPTQPICARAAQIRLFKVNALDATGPVFARHVGDRMYGTGACIGAAAFGHFFRTVRG